MKKKILFFVVCFCLLSAALCVPFVEGSAFADDGNAALSDIGDSHITVHFIDVGQGDSILIELNNGKTMLIDAGSSMNATAPKSISTAYYAYLEKMIPDKTIDYAVCTHPDADHMNMMQGVLDRFQVNEFYYNWFDGAKATYTKVHNKILAEPDCTEHEFNTPDDSILYIEENGYKFTIYSSGNDGFKGGGTVANSMSIITLLEYGGTKVLFVGDAEEKAEEWFVDKTGKMYDDYDIDVLKVGHHGSRGSSSATFLDYVTAEYGVLSYGENNSYGHPHKEAVQRLTDRNVQLYSTEEDGIIDLYMDEDGDFCFETSPRYTANFFVGDTKIYEYERKENGSIQDYTYENVAKKATLTVGTEYAWKADGETITFPYYIAEDTNFYYTPIAENVERTVTYRFIGTETDVQTDKILYGTQYEQPSTVGGRVVKSGIYSDADCNVKAEIDYLLNDYTLYVIPTEITLRRVTFSYDGTPVLQTEVEDGKTVNEISYGLLRTQVPDFPQGTTYLWQVGGHDAIFPYTVTEDTEFSLTVTEENVTCTVTYRLEDQSFTEEYLYGEEILVPDTVLGRKIHPELYSDENYTEGSCDVVTYVTANIVRYVKPDEEVTLIVDGNSVTKEYGERLAEEEDTKTMKFIGYYTDEDRTILFTGIAKSGLVLYSKWERIAYEVTLLYGRNNAESKVLYLSVDDPKVRLSDVEGLADYWYDSDTSVLSVDFPYVVSDDCVLYGDVDRAIKAIEDGTFLENMTDEEKIAVLLVAVAFIIVGIVVLLRYFAKKKKAEEREKSRSSAKKTSEKKTKEKKSEEEPSDGKKKTSKKTEDKSEEKKTASKKDGAKKED